MFIWLALARKMYQSDYVAKTCLCYSYHKPLRVKVLLWLCVGVPAVSCRSGLFSFIYVELFRFVTSLTRGGARPLFFYCWFGFFLTLFICPFARLVEKAVFGRGVLVRETSQHFAGSLGREHIHLSYTSELVGAICMYVAAICVLASVIHGRKKSPLRWSMFFATPGTTR